MYTMLSKCFNIVLSAQISGDLNWLQPSLSSLLQQCLSRLESDPGQWKPGAENELPDITDNLCPESNGNACNGQGTCTKGKQRCHETKTLKCCHLEDPHLN